MSEVEQRRAAKDFSGVKTMRKLSNCGVVLNLGHSMTYQQDTKYERVTFSYERWRHLKINIFQ